MWIYIYIVLMYGRWEWHGRHFFDKLLYNTKTGEIKGLNLELFLVGL